MNKQPPSIFNDVIGPVMRGSSSSHTAASVRIGRIIRQCLPGPCVSCLVKFDPDGSLASTYHEQGADIGLAGGLLGMDLNDPDLVDSLHIARQNNLDLFFEIKPFSADHPNTYQIKASADNGEERTLICLSTGGGMIAVTSIDGFEVSIGGDFYETLFFFPAINDINLHEYTLKIKELIPGYDFINCVTKADMALINLKTGFRITEELVQAVKKNTGSCAVIQLDPVLPVLSRINCQVPFENPAEALSLAKKEGLTLWELALMYESARGGISTDQVYKMAEDLIDIMNHSIAEGLAGTSYRDRILGPQSQKMLASQNRLIGGQLTADLIAKISAVMEAKSAFKVIVASPTAGSCGTLPGTFAAVAEDMQPGQEKVVKGLLAAGLIGVFIAKSSTFAAEECGCQAECGSASGMTAAGLVQMMEGTVLEGFDAAAMALQNVMGMVCDPVAERVEVPCLGKNIMAGLNALGCANMALAGFDRVIPLGETIEAMYSCGRMLPAELRCTGRGGLSVTKTAQEIYKRLNQ